MRLLRTFYDAEPYPVVRIIASRVILAFPLFHHERLQQQPVRPEKNRQNFQEKLHKNDFTRKKKDFNIFAKIA